MNEGRTNAILDSLFPPFQPFQPSPPPPPSAPAMPLAPASGPPAGPSAVRRGGGAPDDGGLRQSGVKLVQYSIVSLRAGAERLLPGASGQVMVTGEMSEEAFAVWRVACYLQSPACRGGLAPEDRKSLRVYYELLDRWEQQPLKFHGKQLAVLEGIRRAILACCGERGAPAPRRLALPAAPPPEPASGDLEKVLAALHGLGGTASTAEIVRHSGLSNSQVRRHLRTLEAQGRIRRQGQGLQTRYQGVGQGSGR